MNPIKKEKKKYSIVFMLLMLMLTGNAQQRPFIWVTQAEKDAILKKIDQQPWADSLYKQFLRRLDVEFSDYQHDAHTFLNSMPFDWKNASSGVTPPFLKVDYTVSGQGKVADNYMRYLQVGIDCGVIYYLTQDEQYAQCALDILNAFIHGISQLDMDENTSIGGWLYSNGQHLREAREIGAQIPIIYDFVKPYIESGGKPYDLGAQGNIEFPQEKAQQVFRTYVTLAIERGGLASNWPVLESPSMVQNLLALEDKTERDEFLKIYLTEGSEWQASLSRVASTYKNEGDIWPESSQYSNVVADWSTILMAMITRYDSSLHLGQQYKNIPMSLDRWEDMKYPNGHDIVRFGDGKRIGGGAGNFAYEVAYFLGKIDSVPEMVEKYGNILTTAIEANKYVRGNLGGRPLSANAYFQPLKLLWFSNDIKGNITRKELPRTDNMDHASLFLQRNLSETENPEDAFMCFVAGAPMIHGHASGMDMELYGKGQVLGIDNGRSNYGSDIHENYYRIFAAHNSVIVNGSSQSEGRWVNLGINPVQLVSMEPMPAEEAVSPNFSFTQTSFVDDIGDKAEAVQQRTLSIVRTSPTTGYYLDVFRSRSSLSDQFHDYLYHNIGDKVEFLDEDMELQPDPERYMANANAPWSQNVQYRHPGWHFFNDVETSGPWNGSVAARFSVEQLGPVYMNLHIPGDDNREYTRVSAPRDRDAPKPYDQEPVPTLIIRKTGEAWDQPFVAVYEPSTEEVPSVKSVHPINAREKVVGAEVRSVTPFTAVTDYIIANDNDEETFVIPGLNVSFEGRFGIVRVESRGSKKRITLYIGDGKSIKFGEDSLYANEKNQGLKIIGELDPIRENLGNKKIRNRSRGL